MTEQEMQMKLASQQEKIKALRQEVAEMNKEREYWQHYRIQAAIAAMQAVLTNYEYYAEGIKTECENSNTTRPKVVAFMARELADALVAELKKGCEK